MGTKLRQDSSARTRESPPASGFPSCLTGSGAGGWPGRWQHLLQWPFFLFLVKLEVYCYFVINKWSNWLGHYLPLYTTICPVSLLSLPSASIWFTVTYSIHLMSKLQTSATWSFATCLGVFSVLCPAFSISVNFGFIHLWPQELEYIKCLLLTHYTFWVINTMAGEPWRKVKLQKSQEWMVRKFIWCWRQARHVSLSSQAYRMSLPLPCSPHWVPLWVTVEAQVFLWTELHPPTKIHMLKP